MTLKLPRLVTEEYIIYCPITKEVYYETDSITQLLEETINIVNNTLDAYRNSSLSRELLIRQENLIRAWFKALHEEEINHRAVTMEIKKALNMGYLELGEIKHAE